MKPHGFLRTTTLKSSFLMGVGKTVVLENGDGITKAVCISLLIELENGSLSLGLHPFSHAHAPGGNGTNLDHFDRCIGKSDVDDQFWGFVYTCIIMGLFSVLILSLMVKSLRDDHSDDDIHDAIQTLHCKVEIERMLYKQRLLREARVAAERHEISCRDGPSTSGDVSPVSESRSENPQSLLVRTDSKMRRAYSCLPNIVVTVPSPPVTRRPKGIRLVDLRRTIAYNSLMGLRTNKESLGSDADDERSMYSSTGSIFV